MYALVIISFQYILLISTFANVFFNLLPTSMYSKYCHSYKYNIKVFDKKVKPTPTCAYAPYAPNWLKTNGFSKFMWPAICCIRLNCRSFSVSANFTTKLDDAPCK